MVWWADTNFFMNWNIPILEGIDNIQNYGSESMHIFYSNIDPKSIWMYHWTIILIKPIPWIWEIPFEQCHVTNLHAYEQLPYFIPGTVSDLSNFVSLGKDLLGVEADRRLTLFFLSYWTNNDSFYNWIWGPLRPSPMFLGTLSFYRSQNYKYGTTDLFW